MTTEYTLEQIEAARKVIKLTQDPAPSFDRSRELMHLLLAGLDALEREQDKDALAAEKALEAVLEALAVMSRRPGYRLVQVSEEALEALQKARHRRGCGCEQCTNPEILSCDLVAYAMALVQRDLADVLKEQP